jgi:glycine/D-amino acid oxidase-like deaminating enzyme
MAAAGAVICGAGIAGVSAGYFLSVVQGVQDVVIVDPRPPLTLTSDKSTECYRNWWPDPSMAAFMDRSIDLLEEFTEESGDAFHLNRRGYLYLHSEAGGMDPDGAEELSRAQVAREFPYLTDQVAGAVRVTRAGWFSAQQLGAWMLERAIENGTTLIRRQVTGVDPRGGRVAAVELDDGSTISTEVFVNSAGPMLEDVAALAGAELPVHNELHLKVAFKDVRGAIPRDAPMLIWADPQFLALSDEERRLCVEQGRTDLLAEMPSGCHCRPEGGPDSEWVLGLWEYHRDVRRPVWPLPSDPLYAQTVLRGLATMIPAVSEYLDDPPESVVDGGYYTKTVENLPLIGPSGYTGAFVCGALSGYGVMAACAAGELAAMHATGASLPGYAAAFDPARYDDPAYAAQAAATADTGQI